MKRPAIRTKVTSIWQKLASMIALLAVAMFVSHAVAAEGTLLYAHDHAMSQTGAAYLGVDAPDGPDWSHKHSATADHQHGGSQGGKPSCCGKACLMALMPDEELQLAEPWATPSKTFMIVSSLAGHDPEGVRRPPRPSHRI
jgi:hypothetical protein